MPRENGHCGLVSRNGNTFRNFKDLTQWIGENLRVESAVIGKLARLRHCWLSVTSSRASKTGISMATYAHIRATCPWNTSWTLTGKRLMYVYMDNQRQRKYENLLDTLKRCQQECTRLLVKNRALKDKLNELDDRVAELMGDLDRVTHRANLRTHR